ncbi:MAG: hypothetical protein WD738_05500 [Pirellulales bacterium]
MASTTSAQQAPDIRQQPPYRSGEDLEIGRDVLEYLREYARRKPEVVALWCFGIGFILGWKLKPW